MLFDLAISVLNNLKKSVYILFILDFHIILNRRIYCFTIQIFILFTDRGLIKTIIEKVLINAEKQPSEVGGGKNHPSNLREKNTKY